MKKPKPGRNDPKAEQAFYDKADSDVPAGIVRLWSRIGRLRRGGGK